MVNGPLCYVMMVNGLCEDVVIGGTYTVIGIIRSTVMGVSLYTLYWR